MRMPDEITEGWTGMIENDFAKTIRRTFALPEEDDYLYQAEPFAMTLSQIQERVTAGNLTWKYWMHGQPIDISDADITAYTNVFAPTTDTTKALRALSANAKKHSPRAAIATYLQSRNQVPATLKTSKPKQPHRNPYLDVWAWTCHQTRFAGPLNDAAYADPAQAKRSHPLLPVLYHHFGCVCPTYEALAVIQQLIRTTDSSCTGGVLDLASGNGYWTYQLRRLGVPVVAVDNEQARWRHMWIADTVRAEAIEYLRRSGGARECLLLLVYMVTGQADLTQRVLRAYKGNAIVVVGSQNANRFTTFAHASVDDYFAREMPAFVLGARVLLPSFAGKDEAMYVYVRKGKMGAVGAVG